MGVDNKGEPIQLLNIQNINSFYYPSDNKYITVAVSKFLLFFRLVATVANNIIFIENIIINGVNNSFKLKFVLTSSEINIVEYLDGKPIHK
tara:strand:- start:196 stop:468 length:273 start_codon:yes stop_codon:yes gene_type:complete